MLGARKHQAVVVQLAPLVLEHFVRARSGLVMANSNARHCWYAISIASTLNILDKMNFVFLSSTKVKNAES